MSISVPRLTSLTHGEGGGSKISAAVLSELLSRHADLAIAPPFPQLLVGLETSDDAAVYQLSAEQALVATTDFFAPVVDDPFDYGRIAATNALSDVYAMGGTPIMALALVGMPVDVLPLPVIREVLRGGESVCSEARIPIAGGHTVDSTEPFYGLVALGLVHPAHVKRNSTARPGDAVILGKPLGVGILSAALKHGQLSEADYQAMLATTTVLNRAGPEIAKLPGVHAMTDVTGYGLLGHLLEICRGSGLGARLFATNLPLLDNVLTIAARGIVTGASERNWSSYGDEVRLTPGLGMVARPLLTDPQTSGGLLVTCAPGVVSEVLAIFHATGCDRAAEIGVMLEGATVEVVT